jgi:hypothetical protein
MSEGFVHSDLKGGAKKCPLTITLRLFVENNCPFGGEANSLLSLTASHRFQTNNCGNSMMNSQNRSEPREEKTNPHNERTKVRCLT